MNPTDILTQVEQLRRATVSQLRAKYQELFGQPSFSNHKAYLFRRVAWRLQALVYGELPDPSRQRALALAQDADLRLSAPKPGAGTAQPVFESTPLSRRRSGLDPRLPAPGTVLQREFRGQKIRVQVLTDGFQYQDRYYKSLSAIARQVAGTRWNGFAFFRLADRENRP